MARSGYFPARQIHIAPTVYPWMKYGSAQVIRR